MNNEQLVAFILLCLKRSEHRDCGLPQPRGADAPGMVSTLTEHGILEALKVPRFNVATPKAHQRRIAQVLADVRRFLPTDLPPHEAPSVMMNKSTLLRLSLSLVAAAMLACSGQQIATPNPATAVPESPTSTPESPTAMPELPTLTSESPAMTTPEPPTSAPEPTPTPESPTPTAGPEPTRIQFEAGATSATVTGSIERTEQSGVEYGEGYVVRALGRPDDGSHHHVTEP